MSTTASCSSPKSRVRKRNFISSLRFSLASIPEPVVAREVLPGGQTGNFGFDPQTMGGQLVWDGGDVGGPWEVQRSTIAGALSIPLRELQGRVQDLDRSREVIVYCHHGGRSRAAAYVGARQSAFSGFIARWRVVGIQ